MSTLPVVIVIALGVAGCTKAPTCDDAYHPGVCYETNERGDWVPRPAPGTTSLQAFPPESLTAYSIREYERSIRQNERLKP